MLTMPRRRHSPPRIYLCVRSQAKLRLHCTSRDSSCLSCITLFSLASAQCSIPCILCGVLCREHRRQRLRGGVGDGPPVPPEVRHRHTVTLPVMASGRSRHRCGFWLRRYSSCPASTGKHAQPAPNGTVHCSRVSMPFLACSPAPRLCRLLAIPAPQPALLARAC